MTTYFSGSETIERESLLDTLSIRYPAETPLIRTLPHVGVNNRIVEYGIDRPFVDADTIRSSSNPHVNSRDEGSAFVEDTARYPTKLKAICEINHFGKKISNTDRTTILAGVTDTFDYRSHQLFVKLLNNIENVLMYGQGAAETSGDGTDIERRTQGLIFWSAWTGTERMHGTVAGAVVDPYGVSIPSDYWSVFYDAAGANLSRSMLYQKILATFHRSGGHVPGLTFHVGAKLKTIIADFGVRPDGSTVNQRNVDASSLMTYDDLDYIRTPLGVVGFRTNRYLDNEGNTFSLVNSDITPGTSSSPGTMSKTFQADETMIGYEPGQVAIGWLRPPHYQMVSTDGDYTRVMAVAEYTLLVRHPLSVVGGGNLIG